jgi:RNA polymerase sigma factor (sigma-70 family)
MASEHKPQQGDEAELFALFNDELMRKVSRAVRTSPETIEDACSIAWAIFLRNQPDRDREWRSWLFKTAQRVAWHLDRERRRTWSLNGEPGDPYAETQIQDQRNAFLEHDELEAARDVLAQLPPRLRRVAFLRATGHRYSEIQEITGDSRTRVSQLIRRANEHLRAALEEIEPANTSIHPRAARLHELEASPPDWLRREIGRAPRDHNSKRGRATELLKWRRAALAIESYRSLTGYDSAVQALGIRPHDEPFAEAFDAAARQDPARRPDRDIEHPGHGRRSSALDALSAPSAQCSLCLVAEGAWWDGRDAASRGMKLLREGHGLVRASA